MFASRRKRALITAIRPALVLCTTLALSFGGHHFHLVSDAIKSAW